MIANYFISATYGVPVVIIMMAGMAHVGGFSDRARSLMWGVYGWAFAVVVLVIKAACAG